MRLSVEQARAYLAQLDGTSDQSLIELLAALQLLPENSRRILRLEVGVHLVMRRTPDQRGDREAGAAEIARWLAASPVGHLEDPLNNLFTDEFPFFGGSYVVFPGTVEQASYVTRRLLEGLYLRDEVPNPQLWLSSADLAMAALRIGDLVARQAGLDRGLSPLERPGVAFPAAQAFAALADATRFTVAELERRLRDVGGFGALAPLIQTPDDGGIRDEEFADGAFYFLPFIQLDDEVILALPHMLLPALSHALLSQFIEEGRRQDAAEALRRGALDNVRRSLQWLHMSPVRINLPDATINVPVDELVVSLDADKLAHVLLVSDALEGYARDTPGGEWPAVDLGDHIRARFDEVEEHLFQMERAPNGVLHVALLHSPGRLLAVGLTERPAHLRGLELMMSAMDFEVIALLEGHDPLALWKYARAAGRVRD